MIQRSLSILPRQRQPPSTLRAELTTNIRCVSRSEVGATLIEVLGFTEDFRFGEHVGIKNGEALLHLCAHTIHARPIGGGAAFVFCDEVDDYYNEIKGNGAIVKAELEDRPYGMKNFTVLDPDGNHLNFGAESRKSAR